MKKLLFITVTILSIFLFSCDEETETVCCESYGIGAELAKCCEYYEWTQKKLCVTPEGLDGGGKQIVSDSFCAVE